MNGFLKKDNLKLTGQQNVDTFLKLQKDNPHIMLCGSLALIIGNLLPEREISDIDVVLNERHLSKISVKINLDLDPYSDLNADDNYASYHGTYKDQTFNFIVFDDDVDLTTEYINYNGVNIKCQKLDDIMKWKEKYNRPKDQEDLDKIIDKLLLEE